MRAGATGVCVWEGEGAYKAQPGRRRKRQEDTERRGGREKSTEKKRNR